MECINPDKKFVYLWLQYMQNGNMKLYMCYLTECERDLSPRTFVSDVQGNKGIKGGWRFDSVQQNTSLRKRGNLYFISLTTGTNALYLHIQTLILITVNVKKAYLDTEQKTTIVLGGI